MVWAGAQGREEATRLQSSFLPLQIKVLVGGDLPVLQHAQGGTSPQPRFSCLCTKFRKKTQTNRHSASSPGLAGNFPTWKPIRVFNTSTRGVNAQIY